MTRQHWLFALALGCAVIFVALQFCNRAAAQPEVRMAAPLVRGESGVIPDQYIVVFNVGRSPVFRLDAREDIALARRQSRAAQDLVRRLGGAVLFEYNWAIIGFAAKMTPAIVEAVRAAPGVAYVQTDLRVTGDAITIQPPTPPDLPPDGLDRIDRRLLAGLDDKYMYSETGAGVHVYVFDTGIRLSHDEFEGRATGLQNFVPDGNASATDDCNTGTGAGHGTGVAAIIGGKAYGVAKAATLHAVRVLDCNEVGDESRVTLGVDAVTQHIAQNAIQSAVVNMSLSGPITTPPSASLQSQENAIKTSIMAGVTYVVSAGNGGVDACSRSPARLADAITVGSVEPTTDARANAPLVSNIGPCIDLFAPGVRILSADAVAGDSKAAAKWSGTSAATPHVAGVAARYLSAPGHQGFAPAAVWSAIKRAANVKGLGTTFPDTVGWGGVGSLGTGSPNVMLHWGPLNDGQDDGEPHITTVDGKRYDFQAVGEFVALREPGGIEIQTRQSPWPIPSSPLPDPNTGLTNCVSFNSAVATRMGNYRVTFQPDPSGVPEPSGLQLRVNGQVANVGPSGVYLGGGYVARTPNGGLDVTYADGAELIVTPGIWNNVWHLNLKVLRTSAMEGVMGAAAPGSWLPALPGGGSMGPMPASLQQRHIDLNEKFADAWRVSGATSLFDYAAEMPAARFTDRSWPPADGRCNRGELRPPRRTAAAFVARRLCGAIADPGTRANCMFDVAVTGEVAFARTYFAAERAYRSSTRVFLYGESEKTAPGEPALFSAVVERRSGGRGAPVGAVQFFVDGRPASDLVPLDRGGRASWQTSRLRLGVSKLTARFVPRAPDLSPSASLEIQHVVDERRRPHY